VTIRAAIAWSPVLALLLASVVSDTFNDPAVGRALIPISLLVFLAGAAYAMANPARGIQDRLAGTWIVPR
jgi:hypothetical protein